MERVGTTAHERKKGQGNVWQGNKTKVLSVIPLPMIPLPMTLLDGPSEHGCGFCRHLLNFNTQC
jgi:hypothetical protein